MQLWCCAFYPLCFRNLCHLMWMFGICHDQDEQLNEKFIDFKWQNYFDLYLSCAFTLNSKIMVRFRVYGVIFSLLGLSWGLVLGSLRISIFVCSTKIVTPIGVYELSPNPLLVLLLTALDVEITCACDLKVNFYENLVLVPLFPCTNLFSFFLFQSLCW